MASPEYYLGLSNNPVRFEAVNQLTNVFFDDSNKHVFAVRSGGVMGVVVKGSDNEEETLNFRMEDTGAVLSIKFSLDRKVLAVQRSNTSVKFMNFNGTSLDSEYSQSCKKNLNILGFVWLENNEVALMTDHGIELYQVIPEKKACKYLRTTSVQVQWFVWCSLNKIALLASAHGSQLQPVHFKPGIINKLPKVETEAGRMALERDVTLTTLYGVPAVLILRHQSGPQCAEVHVHTLSGPGQAPVKTHVLKLGLSGRFAINVVDNLILVHHQASRSSQIFDTALPGESDGAVRYYTSVAPARSFRPAQITLPGLGEPQIHDCELYSPNWVVFQPNIVIDAKLGCLWYIELCLPELCKSIPDLSTCVQLVLRRQNGKPVLLKILLNAIKLPKPPLTKLHESFNHINAVYRDWIESELQAHSASPVGSSTSVLVKSGTSPEVLIDQMDIYNEILQKLNFETDLKNLEWILVSYLTSLFKQGITAQHNLNELLIVALIKNNKFTSLQQLLQYGVVTDSKPLACLLLSLGNVHPAATQLALDMLARLHATDEIQEILLTEGQVLSALRVGEENVNPLKYLQAAVNNKDDISFHSLLWYFQRSSQFVNAFKTDERLTSIVQQYNATFLKD